MKVLLCLAALVSAEPSAHEIAKALAEAGAGQIVQLEEADARLLSAINSQTPTSNTPIVMMHGMGDFAENKMGMVPLAKLAGQDASAYVHSVELCSKPDQLSGCPTEDQNNGFFMTMDDQVDQFARVVRADKNLTGGFNAVGFSQGNNVIRGYLERYNDPPIKSFVSLHGPLMGVNGLPKCPMNGPILGGICKIVDGLVANFGVYSSFMQNRLAQSNYFRDAKNLATYKKDCHFLPIQNNEAAGGINATITNNFKSLTKLALVMALNDTMVQPKESEHFGYYKDGSSTDKVAMEDAAWYTEDWLGLKELNEAKKIDFYETEGDHLRFTKEFFEQMITKYFAPQATILV